MTKELKAFNGICCNTNQSYPDFQKQREIVETALKEYAEIKKIKLDVATRYTDKKQMKERIALEIIKDEFEIWFDDKEQKIDIQSVEYPYPHIRFSLTREIKDKCKYDLLKEVLL